MGSRTFLFLFLGVFPTLSLAQEIPCSQANAPLPPGGTCCEGLLEAVDPFSSHGPGPGHMVKKCSVNYRACEHPSQCCSGQCGPGGRCTPLRKCYPPGRSGAECSINPVCAQGLKCISQTVPDYGVGGVCRALGGECKGDVDCCSQKCVGNKCVRFSLCGQCTKRGRKPAQDVPCCPGLYKSLKGKCIPDIAPGLVEGLIP